MHSSRSICRGSSGCCSSPRWSRSSRLCWCSCARFFSGCRARATRCAREAVDSSRRDRGLSPVRSGHDQILVEAAFQWPVVERRAPGRGQPDQLRKPRIPREEVAAPARVVFLQRIAELRVEVRERRLLADAGAVGRIGDEHARARRGTGIENVGLFELDAVGEARRFQVEAGLFPLLALAVAAADPKPPFLLAAGGGPRPPPPSPPPASSRPGGPPPTARRARRG